jgi:hypothetical protein
LGIFEVCTPWMRVSAPPFQYERSTGNDIFSLARLFDSLVRVSRRVKAPHFRRQHRASRGRSAGASRKVRHPFFPARFTISPRSCTFVCRTDLTVKAYPCPDNAVRLVLAVEMEVLSLSLSRLQVLCHSLSKVLFKLSLTLLVRYRSSYSVFNFGRHIPAA